MTLINGFSHPNFHATRELNVEIDVVPLSPTATDRDSKQLSHFCASGRRELLFDLLTNGAAAHTQLRLTVKKT
jgi:hypothetical protein